MPDLVSLTIDGRTVQAPPGTLLIEAARSAGIKIPSFCYYEGLSLQGACRMCLVEVERAPKLQTACTVPVAAGMVVRTATPQVVQARKSMLEFLLTNHPLDCPVCDKGGECELQEMTVAYGAGESRFHELKQHVDERQWSPLVFYDKPRCILCYRCVRICNEGMGVAALGIVNRGVSAEIAPNRGDRLECDECGMCIDICPVGALTSGVYRYQTRPWEMRHVGVVCTHCADGCTTTLGVYHNRIMRGNNRDRSGVNGEFLCVKGRFAADFIEHPDRLRSPLMRVDGRLAPVTWAQAIAAVAAKFSEVKARGGRFGVIGSNRTTNEENWLLQKFAREGLGTNNIDHHRTGDVAGLIATGRPRATTADLYTARAVLVVASDLAQQHPLLSYQLRANWRHHGARVYVAAEGPVREDRYAVRSARELEALRAELSREPELIIVIGETAVAPVVAFGDSLGIPVKYVCLVDYVNSRGACDMGLLPHLGPGYEPFAEPGLSLPEMLEAELDVLWVLEPPALSGKSPFVVVHAMFPIETADVVLPVASLYEKSGTVTNVCGEVQRVRPAVSVPGVKTDLEIIRLLAKHMGLDLGPPLAEVGRFGPSRADGVWSEPARDTLFTSGLLGRYSKTLQSLSEAPGRLYRGDA